MWIQLCEPPDLALDEEFQTERVWNQRQEEDRTGEQGAGFVGGVGSLERVHEGKRPSVVEAGLRHTHCTPVSISAEKP